MPVTDRQGRQRDAAVPAIRIGPESAAYPGVSADTDRESDAGSPDGSHGDPLAGRACHMDLDTSMRSAFRATKGVALLRGQEPARCCEAKNRRPAAQGRWRVAYVTTALCSAPLR